MSMETGRNLEHTTERHQRGFKVPMEMGSVSWPPLLVGSKGADSAPSLLEISGSNDPIFTIQTAFDWSQRDLFFSVSRRSHLPCYHPR